MTAHKVRADYDALDEIARCFEHAAENTHLLLYQLHRDLDVLLEGDWVGRGATEFYREMISGVLPSVKRLGLALEQAARTARDAGRIMKQAEEDSARLFATPETALAPAAPTLAPIGTAPPPTASSPYTIKSGDTLWAIAISHGVTVDQIKAFNGLTSDLIVAGQVINIPPTGYQPVPGSAPTEANTPQSVVQPDKDTRFLTIAPLKDAILSGNGFGATVGHGMHPGVDIWSTDGNINANADGVVYMYQTWEDSDGWHTQLFDPANAANNHASDELDGFGNYVVLETTVDGKAYYQIYAHMGSFDPNLTQGQTAAAGTALGIMGATGNVWPVGGAGAHVHWEIRSPDGVKLQYDKSGNFVSHNFSIDKDNNYNESYFPSTDEKLNKYFVDPNEFAELLDAGPLSSP